MEWNRLKTILICVFVVVNVFLFVMFFKGQYVDTRLGDELIENTVSILNQNNIFVEKELVPKTHESAKICIVENKYSNMDSLLEDILKVAQKNGAAYFTKENIEIENSSFKCVVKEDKKISNIKKYVKKEIEKTGLLDNVEYSVVEENGAVWFYLKFGSRLFYDSYIKVTATKQGIKEIYCYNWLLDTVSEGGITDTISPAEILINFATEQKADKKTEVRGINPGYYIGERAETLMVTASPSWQITTSDNIIYYYDMRNGDLLAKIENDK